jgi:hypothetical protein
VGGIFRENMVFPPMDDRNLLVKRPAVDGDLRLVNCANAKLGRAERNWDRG